LPWPPAFLAAVYRYGLAFDRLRTLALDPEKSVAYLTTPADTIE